MVEREIELSAEKLERSLFFKTISMKETQKWNEDEERKDFSIFDSSICDEDQDSAYLKKTLSRVRQNKANNNVMHQKLLKPQVLFWVLIMILLF